MKDIWTVTTIKGANTQVRWFNTSTKANEYYVDEAVRIQEDMELAKKYNDTGLIITEPVVILSRVFAQSDL